MTRNHAAMITMAEAAIENLERALLELREGITGHSGGTEQASQNLLAGCMLIAQEATAAATTLIDGAIVLHQQTARRG